MRLRAFVVFVLSASTAEASYRVYELAIRHLDERGKVRRVERVLSTLDANQYGSYHGTNPQLVEVTSTWFCPGDTSRRPFCDRPRKKTLESRD